MTVWWGILERHSLLGKTVAMKLLRDCMRQLQVVAKPKPVEVQGSSAELKSADQRKAEQVLSSGEALN